MLLSGKPGPEFACLEILQRAQAAANGFGGQTSLAVQLAQKICGWTIILLRIAVHAAGNQVTVGIAPAGRSRHNVIQAVRAVGDPAEAIKADATLARVDELAQGARAHEIHVLEDGGEGQLDAIAGSDPVGAQGADFAWQAHFHDVADVAAFDQTQSSFMNQTANREPHALARNSQIVGQPWNRKAKAHLALKAAVAQQMRINGAVEDREIEARREKVLEIFPHLYTIDFFGFYSFVLRRN